MTQPGRSIRNTRQAPGRGVCQHPGGLPSTAGRAAAANGLGHIMNGGGDVLGLVVLLLLLAGKQRSASVWTTGGCGRGHRRRGCRYGDSSAVADRLWNSRSRYTTTRSKETQVSSPTARGQGRPLFQLVRAVGFDVTARDRERAIDPGRDGGELGMLARAKLVRADRRS